MNIDWARVILNLKGAGFTCEWIARKVNMDPVKVRRLANGVTCEPLFSNGLALLNLHADLCPERHDIKMLEAKRPTLKMVVSR